MIAERPMHRLDELVNAAAAWSSGVERRPFTWGRQFPDHEAYPPIEPMAFAAPADPHRVHVETLLYVVEPEAVKRAVSELIDLFNETVAERGLRCKQWRSLPHPPECVHAYAPVNINLIPARFIAMYSLRDQAFAMSLDAWHK